MKGTVIPCVPPEVNVPGYPTLGYPYPIITMSLLEWSFWMWRVDEIKMEFAYNISRVDVPDPFIGSETVIMSKVNSDGTVPTELDVLRAMWVGTETRAGYSLSGTGGNDADAIFHNPSIYFGVIPPPAEPNYGTTVYFAGEILSFQRTAPLNLTDPPSGIDCTISAGTDPHSGQVFPDIVLPFYNAVSGSDTVNSGFMRISPSSYYRWRDRAGNPTYNVDGTLV